MKRFRVQGFGLNEGLRVRVSDLGLKVEGIWFRDEGLRSLGPKV